MPVTETEVPKTIAQDMTGHHREAILDAALLPGQNVIPIAATGHIDDGVATTGLRILKEDALQGKTVLDAYAIGDQGQYCIPQKGDRILVLVLSGEVCDFGVTLGATANGKFTVLGGAEVVCEETVTPGADALVACTVI